MSHAKLTYPEESCGLIVSGEYVPCANTAHNPTERFRISPQTWVQAEGRGEVQAVIHSHPAGPDYPSVADQARQIEMDLAFGIVVMRDGEPLPPFFWGGATAAAPLLGRKFRWGVADCYALAADWYRAELNVILPTFTRGPGWYDEEDLFLNHFEEAGFRQVQGQPEIGDGILMRIGSRHINHCAVYVGNGQLLHHLKDRLSCLDALGPWLRFAVMTIRRAA
jgi:proteasome lid subunit RPN8/RPN11